MTRQLNHAVTGDAVFASLFASLTEDDADIGMAYLTTCAQGVARMMSAGKWALDAFPNSMLKAEYQNLTVGALFDLYMSSRRNLSVAQELVKRHTARVTH
jgi:hypothetical protein